MQPTQDNPLERLMRLAANEPAHRPEFFRVLLSSTVYVLGDAGGNAEKAVALTLEAGSKIGIERWEKADGTPVIPFFTSLEIMRESIDSMRSYLALPVRSLFEITLGTALVLNPKSTHTKEFFPDEVQHLLSDGVSRNSIQRTVQKETRVQVGVPANYPTKMVESLRCLLAKHGNVKRAYVALMHDPSVDDKPHLIVGIETDGDIEQVLREAGNVAGDTVPMGEAVDLCRISVDDTGLSSYFLSQAKPFYERAWGTRLRSIFSKKPRWKDISTELAKNASGDVRAVLGSQLRPQNIWETYELPELMRNPSVTRITAIDPKSGVEKIIFQRN